MARSIADDGKIAMAEALYRMNIYYYPQDAGGFIRIGDFYKSIEHTTEALEAYTTAMEMGAERKL